jgi:hypothetical protein
MPLFCVPSLFYACIGAGILCLGYAPRKRICIIHLLISP